MMNSVSNGLDAIKVDGPTGTCVTDPALLQVRKKMTTTRVIRCGGTCEALYGRLYGELSWSSEEG